MEELILKTSKPSPRLDYIVDFLNEKCTFTIRIENGISDTDHYILQYKTQQKTIPCHSQIAYGYGYKMLNISVLRNKNIPYVFEEIGFDFPFDIFSAIFYVLTMYEQYNPDVKRDLHGRITSDQLFIVKNDLHTFPIIDAWMNLFIQYINQSFNTTFDAIDERMDTLTVDIDDASAFTYKSTKRKLLSSLKSLLLLRINDLSWKLNSWNDAELDPFWTYSKIQRFVHESGWHLKWFVLMSQQGEWNSKNRISSKMLNHLINVLKTDISIHGSYSSSLNMDILQDERNELERYTVKPITGNRFHFLRYTLPHSFEGLESIGIKDDYSVGFYDQIGFMAGTSRSFLWYNLENEKVSTLRLHPFIAMDVTMKDYMSLSPKEALSRLVDLYAECEKYRLPFVLLWHNSSFSDLHGFANWTDFLDKLHNSTRCLTS